jgi:hypothetical protein
VEGAAQLTLGNGLDPAVTMGPVISAAHRERVAGYVTAGERDGATLLLDGRGATVAKHPAGHWFGPTVFENVTPDMSLGRDEIFGRSRGSRRPPRWRRRSPWYTGIPTATRSPCSPEAAARRASSATMPVSA